jgi:hypothetical protein
MKRIRSHRLIFMLATAILIFAVPMLAAAQGRGRGWARGHNKNWKCSIFVNCHDARDGRLDGRGPRANRVGLRNGVFVNRGRRMRVRRFRPFDDDVRFRERRFGNSEFGRDRFMRRDQVRPPDREFRNMDVFRARGRGRRP